MEIRPALLISPCACRKPIFKEIIPGKIWTFDQLIGTHYVKLPIVWQLLNHSNNSMLYLHAPIGPIKICLALFQQLIDKYRPVKHILLPSVAVEHYLGYCRTFNVLFF